MSMAGPPWWYRGRSSPRPQCMGLETGPTGGRGWPAAPESRRRAGSGPRHGWGVNLPLFPSVLLPGSVRFHGSIPTMLPVMPGALVAGALVAMARTVVVMPVPGAVVAMMAVVVIPRAVVAVVVVVVVPMPVAVVAVAAVVVRNEDEGVRRKSRANARAGHDGHGDASDDGDSRVVPLRATPRRGLPRQLRRESPRRERGDCGARRRRVVAPRRTPAGCREKALRARTRARTVVRFVTRSSFHLPFCVTA